MEFTIWMTSNCNFRCKYCYVNKQETIMSEETSKETIKFIKKHMKDRYDEKIKIIFHGGEPFLNYKQIIFIYNELNKIYKNRISFYLTTNGSIINNDIEDFLNNENVELSVSLDGEKLSNDENRITLSKQSSYDLVISFLKRMKHINKKVKIRMTVNHLNVNELFENFKHIYNLGYIFISFAPDESDKWNNYNFNVYKQNLHKILNFLKKENTDLYNCYKENLKIFYFNAYKPCKGGITSLHIGSNGSLYPCLLSVGNNKYIIGNIYNGINKTLLNNILQYNLIDNNTCFDCKMKKNCQSNRCKIINELRTGNALQASPVSCYFQHINYEELF